MIRGLAGVLLVVGCQSAPDVPKLGGRVNDYAEAITPDEEAELTRIYESLERQTGSQMALLTIRSLQGAKIEDYSLKVAQAWALGRRDIDDGVLITVAWNEHSLRIEVGYGLERVISDEAAGDVIQHMLPDFRAGHPGRGLQLGSRELVQMILDHRELIGQRRQ